MVDGVEVMSKISGLSKETVQEIWEETQANHRRLQECKGPHDFQPVTDGHFSKAFRCSLCGGEVSATNASWYIRGLKHGS